MRVIRPNQLRDIAELRGRIRWLYPSGRDHSSKAPDQVLAYADLASRDRWWKGWALVRRATPRNTAANTAAATKNETVDGSGVSAVNESAELGRKISTFVLGRTSRSSVIVNSCRKL